jgi:integrase
MRVAASIYQRKLADGTKYWMLKWIPRHGTRYKALTLGVITKLEAEAALIKKKTELTQGIKSINVPYFKDYIIHYCCWHDIAFPDNGAKRSLIDNVLLPFFKNYKLDQITDTVVREFIKETVNRPAFYGTVKCNGKKLSNGTINKYIKALRAILRLACKDGILTKYPIMETQYLSVKNARVVGMFAPEELDVLYASPVNPHWWKFLANTGIRSGEARMLEWSWIKDDHIKIISTEENPTKSGKSRKVPMTDAVREALIDFRRIENHEKYVFGELVSTEVIRIRLKRALKGTGIEGTPHKFRHSFCSYHAMAGTPIKLIQEMAGHAEYKTTEGYIHVLPQAITGLNLRIGGEAPQLKLVK